MKKYRYAEGKKRKNIVLNQTFLNSIIEVSCVIANICIIIRIGSTILCIRVKCNSTFLAHYYEINVKQQGTF